MPNGREWLSKHIFLSAMFYASKLEFHLFLLEDSDISIDRTLKAVQCLKCRIIILVIPQYFLNWVV